MPVDGNRYRDVSVLSLSAAQASAAATVIDRRERVALVIVPPADCTLRLAPGGGPGLPLYGEVANMFIGGECPTNALYISGLSAGQAVTIWEA